MTYRILEKRMLTFDGTAMLMSVTWIIICREFSMLHNRFKDCVLN